MVETDPQYAVPVPELQGGDDAAAATYLKPTPHTNISMVKMQITVYNSK